MGYSQLGLGRVTKADYYAAQEEGGYRSAVSPTEPVPDPVDLEPEIAPEGHTVVTKITPVKTVTVKDTLTPEEVRRVTEVVTPTVAPTWPDDVYVPVDITEPDVIEPEVEVVQPAEASMFGEDGGWLKWAVVLGVAAWVIYDGMKRK